MSKTVGPAPPRTAANMVPPWNRSLPAMHVAGPATMQLLQSGRTRSVLRQRRGASGRDIAGCFFRRVHAIGEEQADSADHGCREQRGQEAAADAHLRVPMSAVHVGS